MGKRLALVFSTLIIWSLLAVFLIFGSVFVLPNMHNGNHFNFFLASSSRNIFQAEKNKESLVNVLALVKSTDARGALIDRFLEKYGSPMSGTGNDFVKAADRYDLDWRLLPAIAFQESNLGKKIPAGSYNPFGWAIYKGANSGTYFQSWTDAINIVAAGIKEDYHNIGLKTPETIVLKYTDKPSPSWVFAVKNAMEEISDLEY